MKIDFDSSKTLYKPHIQHYAENITRMLASHLRHALCQLHLSRVQFCTHSFLLALLLKQRFEDCTGNTKHSNVNVNTECIGK